MSKDTLVLLSGGVDSIVLASVALFGGRLAACLFVDYGQPCWLQEKTAAERWCAARGIPLHMCNAILAGTPLGEGVGVPGPRVVPGRNLALLAVAANYAVTLELAEVWFGATLEDRADYPDCRSEFVEVLNVLLGIDTGVRIVAPLVFLSRAQVLDAGREAGADLTGCWSCYEPTPAGERCGTCNGCRRMQA